MLISGPVAPPELPEPGGGGHRLVKSVVKLLEPYFMHR